VPQREPPRETDSDVPDGFEFLNRPSSEPTPQSVASPAGGRQVQWVLALAVLVVIAVAVVVAVRALPDAATTSSPVGEPTRSAPEPSPSTDREPSGAPRPSQPPDPSDGLAIQVLAQLDVKGRAPTTGYEREQFGPDWADVEDNGCDTRNDVLERDLVRIVTDTDDSCLVQSGTLLDPYSGQQIDFIRGWETSFAVQIDHVVALSNAWQTGAQYWKPRKRLRFANDPLNLLAVDGELNLQKSDGDAATWLPPSKPYRCEYVARQIAVKSKYGLWITPPERDAMARILSTCPDQDLPVASLP
jgi:hypothetical protein